MRSINSRLIKWAFSSSVQIFFFFAICPIAAIGQQWQAIAPMHFARQEAAAVTLLDGRVLVAGGNDGTNSLASCELYDPNTNTWTITGSMNEPRWRFPMVRLKDGRVFVAGGITGPFTDNTVATTSGCEIYDPKTGQWTMVANMAEASENFPLLVLPDGRVFMNGGLDANNGTYLSQTEVFDPQTSSIQELAPSPVPFFGQIAFFDSIHSQVIIQGGSNGGLGGLYWNTSQVYDFAGNSWSYGAASLAEHDTYCPARMPDGTLVMLGGRASSYVAHDTVEALSPPYTKWKFLAHLTSPRWHECVLRVNNDSILVIGGNNDPGVNSGAYDSTNWFAYGENQIFEGPRMLQARSVFVDALTQVTTGCVDSTLVLVFGGLSKDGRVLNSCERLVIGNSGALSHPSLLHRSAASAYANQVDSLPLVVDVNTQVNLDSLWPTLTEIQGTYAWDSSVVSFLGYEPPAGWVLNALTNHRNSLDFDIANNGSTATTPLDLGTALFKPHTTELATSWISLPVLTLTAGGDVLSLCTSQNEDSHWSVKTLGEPSSVSPSPNLSPKGGEEFTIWPNPAGNEIFVKNPGAAAHIALYDALGREVEQMDISATSTSTLDIHALAAGMYFVRIVCGDVVNEQTIIKQ